MYMYTGRGITEKHPHKIVELAQEEPSTTTAHTGALGHTGALSHIHCLPGHSPSPLPPSCQPTLGSAILVTAFHTSRSRVSWSVLGGSASTTLLPRAEYRVERGMWGSSTAWINSENRSDLDEHRGEWVEQFE